MSFSETPVFLRQTPTFQGEKETSPTKADKVKQVSTGATRQRLQNNGSMFPKVEPTSASKSGVGKGQKPRPLFRDLAKSKQQFLSKFNQKDPPGKYPKSFSTSARKETGSPSAGLKAGPKSPKSSKGKFSGTEIRNGNDKL